MPVHSDRRETQQSAKRGPPLRGCRRKPLGQRRLAWTGNQPALHKAPCREASCGNHGCPRRVVVKELAADSARHGWPLRFGGNGNRPEAAFPLRQRPYQCRTLGANCSAVAAALHVNPRDNGAIATQKRGGNAEAGVSGLGKGKRRAGRIHQRLIFWVHQKNLVGRENWYYPS